ncbi:MAG: Sec-independent protein translocase protein TatB [Pseudomonadota bacterium]
MLDIGWSELLILGIAALLVVGPRDLPSMFRTVGQYVGRARSMAREFQRSMEDAARQADLEDVRKAAESVKDVGRIAAGGTAGLAQFGMDKTRKYAEDALKSDAETSAETTAKTVSPAAASPASASPNAESSDAAAGATSVLTPPPAAPQAPKTSAPQAAPAAEASENPTRVAHPTPKAAPTAGEGA